MVCVSTWLLLSEVLAVDCTGFITAEYNVVLGDDSKALSSGGSSSSGSAPAFLAVALSNLL